MIFMTIILCKRLAGDGAMMFRPPFEQQFRAGDPVPSA
jgi:hypothetical protein